LGCDNLKKAAKCCKHCQDFDVCKRKGKCCKYCDYYFKAKCTYNEKIHSTSKLDSEFEETSETMGEVYSIDEYEEFGDYYS